MLVRHAVETPGVLVSHVAQGGLGACGKKQRRTGRIGFGRGVLTVEFLDQDMGVGTAETERIDASHQRLLGPCAKRLPPGDHLEIQAGELNIWVGGGQMQGRRDFVVA